MYMKMAGAFMLWVCADAAGSLCRGCNIKTLRLPFIYVDCHLWLDLIAVITP